MPDSPQPITSWSPTMRRWCARVFVSGSTRPGIGQAGTGGATDRVHGSDDTWSRAVRIAPIATIYRCGIADPVPHPRRLND